ncbi:MAG TPA: GrpB family protein [Thermoleophilia bacterium]|nr:GrpB family protein [Thermoleophilia bacterium]
MQQRRCPRHGPHDTLIRSSRFHREHLAFRDALRADARLREEHQPLKSRLAAEFGSDREGYGRAKSGFIEAALSRKRRRRR